MSDRYFDPRVWYAGGWNQPNHLVGMLIEITTLHVQRRAQRTLRRSQSLPNRNEKIVDMIDEMINHLQRDGTIGDDELEAIFAKWFARDMLVESNTPYSHETEAAIVAALYISPELAGDIAGIHLDPSVAIQDPNWEWDPDEDDEDDES